MQNFVYALIQILHNFGAVAIVGIPAVALFLMRDDMAGRHRLAIFAISAWAIQAISGALFGLSTFYFEHHLPDIHGIAVDALIIKMICAVSGIILAVMYVRRDAQLHKASAIFVWCTLLALGVVALCSAAFLRWFS